jgi:hypothetical protein
MVRISYSIVLTIVGLTANPAIAQDTTEEFLVLDEAALRGIIRSITEPTPEVEKKRESYSSISSVRRFYHKNPHNQIEEQIKYIRWHPYSNQTYVYSEALSPPALFVRISTPDEEWLVSRSRKWAVKNEASYTQGSSNNELDEMLSYVIDLKVHPQSQYNLVNETDTSWVIDEIPSKSFVDRLEKNILAYGNKISLAPELMNNPRLALLRVTIDKEWRLVVAREIYGESGALWYQTHADNFTEVTPNPALFKLPSGCTVLGSGDEKFKKMINLEKQNRKNQ